MDYPPPPPTFERYVTVERSRRVLVDKYLFITLRSTCVKYAVATFHPYDRSQEIHQSFHVSYLWLKFLPLFFPTLNYQKV